jgi:hypothetical protein
MSTMGRKGRIVNIRSVADDPCAQYPDSAVADADGFTRLFEEIRSHAPTGS